MIFKVSTGFFIVIAGFLCLGFLGLCFKFLRDYVERLFSVHDEEESLTDEEKHKRYLEKKHREIAKERVNAKFLHKSSEVHAEYQDIVKIIGLMEPIGRWTRFVMSEKRQKLIGMKPSQLQNGFWQMLVSMKGMYQGKHKGRSR
ncbi:hypothetical protein [Anaplasma phagocytophilum]|uniref:hypothetical protein n=1 Tax=Anaplasma phagocytophilum TaxID=948 RepID=UPI00200CEE97|nr:hypothetical protein [Anaplasma phagocytophilum]UQD54034.1 hypothetical protein ESP60_00870 [Anaplasma phagocytophilum]